jgi:hypothetical protein
VTSSVTGAPVAGARLQITYYNFGASIGVLLASDTADLAGRFVLVLQSPLQDSTVCATAMFSAAATGFTPYVASLAAVGAHGDACDGRADGVSVVLTPNATLIAPPNPRLQRRGTAASRPADGGGLDWYH